MSFRGPRREGAGEDGAAAEGEPAERAAGDGEGVGDRDEHICRDEYLSSLLPPALLQRSESERAPRTGLQTSNAGSASRSARIQL